MKTKNKKTEVLRNLTVLGDALEVLPNIGDREVDLIFTSPPHISETKYKNLRDFKHFQDNFCHDFARVIKDDGFVVICQANHRYKAQIVSNYAIYHKLLTSHGFVQKDEKIVYRTPNIGRKDLFRFTYQIMTVWTKKGTFVRKGDFIADTLIDEQVTLKGTTHWTANLCSLVINALTQEKAFVVDPFAGNGIVTRTAKMLNRDWLAIEMNPEVYKATLEAK